MLPDRAFDQSGLFDSSGELFSLSEIRLWITWIHIFRDPQFKGTSNRMHSTGISLKSAVFFEPAISSPKWSPNDKVCVGSCLEPKYNYAWRVDISTMQNLHAWYMAAILWQAGKAREIGRWSEVIARSTIQQTFSKLAFLHWTIPELVQVETFNRKVNRFHRSVKTANFESKISMPFNWFRFICGSFLVSLRWWVPAERIHTASTVCRLVKLWKPSVSIFKYFN